MKRLFGFLAVLMVMSLVLGACGTPAAPATEAPVAPAEKTVLNVWSFTNEILTMAVAFEKSHPNVDVVYTMIPMTNLSIKPNCSPPSAQLMFPM